MIDVKVRSVSWNRERESKRKKKKEKRKVWIIFCSPPFILGLLLGFADGDSDTFWVGLTQGDEARRVHGHIFMMGVVELKIKPAENGGENQILLCNR